MKRADRVLERRDRTSQPKLHAAASSSKRVVTRRTVGQRPQSHLKASHLAHAQLHQINDRYLTYRALAERLSYRGKRAPEAARKFVERKGIQRFKRGRAWTVLASHVDLVMAGYPAPVVAVGRRFGHGPSVKKSA